MFLFISSFKQILIVYFNQKRWSIFWFTLLHLFHLKLKIIVPSVIKTNLKSSQINSIFTIKKNSQHLTSFLKHIHHSFATMPQFHMSANHWSLGFSVGTREMSLQRFLLSANCLLMILWLSSSLKPNYPLSQCCGVLRSPHTHCSISFCFQLVNELQKC